MMLCVDTTRYGHDGALGDFWSGCWPMPMGCRIQQLPVSRSLLQRTQRQTYTTHTLRSSPATTTHLGGEREGGAHAGGLDEGPTFERFDDKVLLRCQRFVRVRAAVL